ncbi:RING/U-box superfamily protein [Hibiscus syriacus]|uniref:RING/U-box superfamily protein n=1 Tax=Hibiscus syriacus TaxID=106335 RepID=A0A6A3AML7_HIBSY|nr:remorin 1.4-like [Hibiscus syriacus]KAE8705376.1 RING/U-box superfamily protein [Hibiscus syriacus]
MTSWNRDSNHKPEKVVGIAAATYVITSTREPCIHDQKKSNTRLEPSLMKDKSKKEDASSTSKPGTVSEQFLGEGSKKVSERADSKVPVINAAYETERRRVPSFKRPLSFSDQMGSSSRTQLGSSQNSETLYSQPESAAPRPDQHIMKPGIPATRPELPPTINPVAPVTEAERQSGVRAGSEQAKADSWEKAQMAKIKERYVKLNETIAAWEEKKKKKARSKLEKAEKSESEKKIAKALAKFRNEMDYIKQVADGARGEAKARQRNDELKAKGKANIIRTTGELPVTCFCCQT